MTLRARLITMGLGAALTIVPMYEGLRTVTYKDPIGIATVCYGHTGKDVELGKQYSLQECEDRLEADLLAASRVVSRCTEVPLSPGEFSAYTSFAFNVGPGRTGVKDGFCQLRNGRVPTFLKKLNSGDREGACIALLQWNKAGGVILRGLKLRREREATECLLGVYASFPKPT